MRPAPYSLPRLAQIILNVCESLAEADTQRTTSNTEIERMALEKVAATLQQIGGTA